MEGKGVGKDRFIAAIEVAAGNSRGVEWEAHVREARANELSINSRVMREGRANNKIMIIKLFCENMLKLESQSRSSKLPKGRRIFKSFAESRNRVPYVEGNGIRQGEVEACHEQEGARSSFCP